MTIHYFHEVGGYVLPKGTHIEVREGEDTVNGLPDPNWTVWVISERKGIKFEHCLKGLWGHSFTPEDVVRDAGNRLGEAGLHLVTKTKWKIKK